MCNSSFMNQLENFRDMPSLLGEHAQELKEKDKQLARKESKKIIEALSLPCELTDAERAGGGKIQVDGRMLDIKVYEAACRSGTGYFLVSQPPQKSLAVSCFAAEAAHAADVAQGVKPDDFTCTLSGSKDVKSMAASVLNGSGTACDVSD